jgi:RNA polymerase primary sigma factor
MLLDCRRALSARWQMLAAAIADAPVGPAEALDGQGKNFAAILGLTSGLEISSRSSARSLRRARPGGSVTACCDPDQKTLQAALKGDIEAAAAFTRAAADLVWNACQRVTRSEAETEEAFREVMAALRADGFARLKGYDGRARVRVYLALVVRDLLVERILRLLALDAERGWRAFEAFFAEDMRRMILRMLPGSDQEQNREDAYQSVCEALLKNDLQRLRAYSGRGSPSGFILHVIENLIIDYVRTIVPRRRLPTAIARLAALDQSIFRLLYWERLAPDPVLLLVHLPREKTPPTAAVVAEAVARVRASLPCGYYAQAPARTIDISAAEEWSLAGGAESFAVPTPEEQLAEGEASHLLDAALAAVQRVLPRLEATERLYLQLALTGQPAREIAPLLGLPVGEVHKLAQRVKKRLREEIGAEAAIKKWRLSV